MNLRELPTPALVIDFNVLRYNVDRMAKHFASVPAKLRPHFKAHKCIEIARLQRDTDSVVGFTCATVDEVEVLSEAGFDDLLLANEVASEDKARRLAEVGRGRRVIAAVDSQRQVELLERACRGAGSELGVVVDVNVGLPRCGVEPERSAALANRVASSDHLCFEGLMGYEGHCVLIEDRAARERCARSSMERLLRAVELVNEEGLEARIVSAGGTGTYDITGTLEGITEVQAGSYVLMDDAYAKLGLGFERGLFVLATVISRASSSIAVADAGLKALSTDHGLPEVVGCRGAKVLFLSDEHATIAVGSGTAAPTSDAEVPDRDAPTPGIRTWNARPPVAPTFEEGSLLLLSVPHIDPTINMHSTLFVVEGEEVVDSWPVAARGYRHQAPLPVRKD